MHPNWIFSDVAHSLKMSSTTCLVPKYLRVTDFTSTPRSACRLTKALCSPWNWWSFSNASLYMAGGLVSRALEWLLMSVSGLRGAMGRIWMLMCVAISGCIWWRVGEGDVLLSFK